MAVAAAPDDAAHDGRVSLVFCVPRPRQGAVLGKGGQVAQQLSETFGVRLTLPPKGGPELNTLTVTGLPDAVENCRVQLEGLLSLPVGCEPLEWATLDIPQQKFGVLIGTKGAVLEQFQREYQVWLELPRDGNAKVTGSGEGIAIARARIEEVLRRPIQVLDSGLVSMEPETGPAVADPVALDPAPAVLPPPLNLPERDALAFWAEGVAAAAPAAGDDTVGFHIPRCLHGLIIGSGGERVKDIEQRNAVSFRIPRADEEACDVVAVTGPPLAVEACRAELEELLSLPVGREPLQQVTLGVPRSKCGALIGKGGAVLKAVCQECRVLIRVPRSAEPGNVEVVGRPDGVAHAKARIEEILRDSVPVLALDVAETPRVPMPACYNLASAKRIQRVLFFPDHPEEDDDSGLTTMQVFLKYLDSARWTIEACVFALTDDRITRRLLDAHRHRGVRVRVLTDSEQGKNPGADNDEIAAAGIELRVDGGNHHMHHKFCILDGLVLMNGSFNWTRAACETNNENVMITNDRFFVQEFRDYFENLWTQVGHRLAEPTVRPALG